MNRLSSTRLRLAPSPPILISSTAWLTVLALRPVLISPELLSGPEHRLDDVLVAGAAAQVARQRPADLFLARVRVLVEQLLGGQHHPRRAEAALEPVLLPKALLKRVQLAGGGHALHGGDLVPVGLDGQHRARLDRPA